MEQNFQKLFLFSFLIIFLHVALPSILFAQEDPLEEESFQSFQNRNDGYQGFQEFELPKEKKIFSRKTYRSYLNMTYGLGSMGYSGFDAGGEQISFSDPLIGQGQVSYEYFFDETLGYRLLLQVTGFNASGTRYYQRIVEAQLVFKFEESNQSYSKYFIGFSNLQEPRLFVEPTSIGTSSPTVIAKNTTLITAVLSAEFWTRFDELWGGQFEISASTMSSGVDADGDKVKSNFLYQTALFGTYDTNLQTRFKFGYQLRGEKVEYESDRVDRRPEGSYRSSGLLIGMEKAF